MLSQYFILGQDDWSVVVLYDIRPSDLPDVFDELCDAGEDVGRAEEACVVLSGWNKGYTYTSYLWHRSVMCIGRAVSRGQLFNTILHEVKHLVEHISTYYGADPKGEESAYLQGEVGLQVWPFVREAMGGRGGMRAIESRGNGRRDEGRDRIAR